MDCANFDAQVVRQDKAVLAMADQFVFLRIVRMNGVDLNLFHFDYDLTWMGFFLNADGRIYARYGGRDASSAESRISRDGLLHAMNEVLRIHKEESAKQLPPPQPQPPLYPEDLTMLKGRARRGGDACIRCHMVNDAFNLEARLKGKNALAKELRRDSFYAFPLPENVGIVLDLVRGNRVRDILPNSAAATAGLKKGDVVHAVNGQLVVTAFDMQNALNEVGKDNKAAVTAERAGREMRFDLNLRADWRRRDVSWRKSLRNAFPNLGCHGEDLSPQTKSDLKVAPDDLAFHVLAVQANGSMSRAGLKSGDVIVSVDGKRKIPYSYFQAYFLLEHNPGDKVELIFLRDDKERTATLIWR